MMHWLALPLLVLAPVAEPPAPAPAISSAATPLILKFCESRPVEGGKGWRCAGLPGTDVFLQEIEGRQSVMLGLADGRPQSFDVPHSIARTMEWRIAGNQPQSGIVRYSFPDGAGGPAQDLLVIFKVGSRLGPGCIVAVVDPVANSAAPELARQIADERSPGFRCGTDRPEAAGRLTARASAELLPALR